MRYFCFYDQHYIECVRDKIIGSIFLRAFGVTLSLTKRNKLRLIQGFETVDNAVKRTEESLEKIELVKYFNVYLT